MNVGVEWLVDAEGCSEELLRDINTLQRVCERIIFDLGLNVVGSPAWHQFAGAGGVTGLYLLTESHLACHTYPELGAATFNLYCCRERPRWAWEERLCEMLGAARVVAHFHLRGSGISPVELRSELRETESAMSSDVQQAASLLTL
jgi:S-adenosylmethionine decarboxylase